MGLKPCLACGALTHAASHCQRHAPRNGSTRQWRTTRAAILARDGYRCRYCGSPAEHVDHIVPVSRGGSDFSRNLQALCATCNRAKSDR